MYSYKIGPTRDHFTDQCHVIWGVREITVFLMIFRQNERRVPYLSTLQPVLIYAERSFVI